MSVHDDGGELVEASMELAHDRVDTVLADATQWSEYTNLPPPVDEMTGTYGVFARVDRGGSCALPAMPALGCPPSHCTMSAQPPFPTTHRHHITPPLHIPQRLGHDAPAARAPPSVPAA